MVVVINDKIVSVALPDSWVNYDHDILPERHVDLHSDDKICSTGDVRIYITPRDLRTREIRARCTHSGKLGFISSGDLQIISHLPHFTRLLIGASAWLNYPNIPKSHRLYRICQQQRVFDLFPLEATLTESPDKLLVYSDWLDDRGSDDDA